MPTLRARGTSVFGLIAAVWIGALCLTAQTLARQAQPPSPTAQSAGVQPAAPAAPRAVLDKYCVTCHNQRLRTAGLALDTLDAANPGGQRRSVGEGDREAASSGRCRRPEGRGRTPRRIARWRRRSKTRSIARGRRIPTRAHRRRASAESRRIQQRDPRPVCARPASVDVRPLLPGDETADGSFDNFADVALDFDDAPRALSVGRAAGHAPRHGTAAGRAPRWSDLKFRCT